MVTEKILETPLKRRGFLALMGIAAAVGYIGVPGSGFAREDGFSSFMKTSLFLTDNDRLNPETGRAIYSAFSAVNKNFDSDIAEFNAYVEKNGLKASSLRDRMANGNGRLSALPGDILKAWYTGVVGEGAEARAVVFENALMFRPVSDFAVIPSYATGAYGSWIVLPESIRNSSGDKNGR